MRKWLERLGALRPRRSEAPRSNADGRWHPVFYKALQVHILETTKKN